MRYRPKSCQIDQGTIIKQAIDGIFKQVRGNTLWNSG